MTRLRFCALTLAAIGGPLSAVGQVFVNGNFETGGLSPWVVTPTPGGTTLFSDVSLYDIDGPAPQPATQAARFMVGKTGPAVQGSQGIELTQTVQLQAGLKYRFWVRWSVKPLVNVHNQTGGQFDFIVDGVVKDTDIAPATTGLSPSYGWLACLLEPTITGAYQIGVRITRPVVAGEEVFQFIDNFQTKIGCWTDWNEDGRVTINDYGCFQTRYVMQDPWADCNASGTFTIADFGCWRAAVAAGCP